MNLEKVGSSQQVSLGYALKNIALMDTLECVFQLEECSINLGADRTNFHIMASDLRS